MRVVVIGGGIAGPAAARRLTLLRVFAGRFGGRDAYRGVGIPDCIESGERARGIRHALACDRALVTRARTQVTSCYKPCGPLAGRGSTLVTTCYKALWSGP